MTRVVVIGNGMAGTRLVQELRRRDPGRRFMITVIGAEPAAAYNRVLLSQVLAGSLEPDAIALAVPSWYEAHGVSLLTGMPAVRLDRAARLVTLADGTVVPYDLLVLATGSVPWIPPVPGLLAGAAPNARPVPGVTVFRTLADCREIIARLGSARRVAVLGGGLLGLEAARGLAGRGLDVDIVHPVDWLMERQLDADAGRVLVRALTKLGVRSRLGVGAARYVAGPDRRLVLTDGTELPTDLVVLSCGVRPDVELAAASGLPVDRGIVVDDQLRSQGDPAVHAIGECAQHAGEVYGLVAPAWEQAAVLAAVITGEAAAAYTGSRIVTRLKAADVDLAAMGDTHASDDDESTEVVRFLDPARGSYQKLVIRDGRLAGAIVLGDNPAIGTVTQLFDRDASVPSDRRTLILGAAPADSGADPSRLPDRVTVCRCNGVTKGAISAAWQGGARSLTDVASRTRATTGCGSCRGAVEGLVDWLAETDPQEVGV